MEGFEVFQKSRKRGPNQLAGPRASIASNGNITLNEEALALYAENLPAFVIILFNKDQQVVAFKPTTEDDPNGYKLREIAKSKSRSVGAKLFFTHYEMEPQRATLNAVRLNDMVAFSLNPDVVLEGTTEEAPKTRKTRAA